MNKRIEIQLIDPDFNDEPLYFSDDRILLDGPIHPHLCKDECKNILKQAKKVSISTDQLIDAIVLEMYKRQIFKMSIDIDGREKSYEPAKEMTLYEIEAALGHKVKIVNENKEGKNER